MSINIFTKKSTLVNLSGTSSTIACVSMFILAWFDYFMLIITKYEHKIGG